MMQQENSAAMPWDRRQMEEFKEQLKDELFYEFMSQQPRGGSKRRYFDPYGYEAMQRIMEGTENDIRDYMRDLQQVRDPYVRRILRNMVMDERRNQMRAFDAMDMYANPQNTNLWKRRLSGIWDNPENRNFLLGAGAALLAVYLLPGLKDKLQNVASRSMEGLADLGDQAQDFVSGIKEDLEDIVAEAKFENMKKQIDREIQTPKTPGKK